MVEEHSSRPVMEVDAAHRQSGGLPSINYLQFNKMQAEDQRHASLPAFSPTTIPSGPPPPYSYPSAASANTTPSAPPTASSVPAIPGLLSPPESRRTSGDEKEPPPPPPPPRQSLPSIFEALKEPSIAYNSPMPASAHHAPTSTSTSSTVSSTTAVPRSNPHETSTQERPRYIHPSAHHAPPPTATSTYPSFPPSQPPATSQPDSRRVSLATAYPQESHISTLPALRNSSVDRSRENGQHPESPSVRSPASPRYEAGPPSATSMNSSSNFAGSYQPPSSYQSSHTLHPSNPPSTYHSPTTYGSSHLPFASRFDGSEVGRVQEAQQTFKGFKGVNAERYGNSVKRHLDFFDLEASLNEIADSSGRTNEFSREYISRVRETKRAGPFAGSVPSLTEIDEIIHQQDRVRDLFSRMREMLVDQHNALNTSQQSQDGYHKANAGGGAGNEYDLEESSVYNDDGGKASGLLGPEAKKRRGRAAPPGRCHSCNRAETPEWRRGPDGARTLCNACGLHYAKLTRKMSSKSSLGGGHGHGHGHAHGPGHAGPGGAGVGGIGSGGPGGSSLRPKSAMGSPRH